MKDLFIKLIKWHRRFGVKMLKRLEGFDEDKDADKIDVEQTKLFFKDLSGVENIDDILKSMLKADRIRYFNAPPESQNQIKGAFNRTLYWLNEIRKARDKKEKVGKDNVGYANPRHI